MSQPAMNPAVLHCLQAYHHAQAAGKQNPLNPKATAFENHKALHEAEKAAKAAYCQAMPTFRDHASIFDYIACVSHALLLDIIPERLASKLLYSAQVALGALRAITQAETQAAKAQAGKAKPNHPTPSPSEPVSPAQSTPLQPGDSPATISAVSANPAISANTHNPTPSPSNPVTPASSTPPPTSPANSATSANPANPANPANSAAKHTDPLMAHATELLRRALLERKSA